MDLSAIIGILGPAIAAVWVYWSRDQQKKREAELEQRRKEQEANIAARERRLAADLEAARQKLVAELEATADEREYRQEQMKLQSSYQQAETSVAHQLMAELVSDSQEALDEAYDFIKKNIKGDIATLQTCLNTIEERSRTFEEVPRIKYEIAQFTVQSRIMVNMMRDIYERLFNKQPEGIPDD